MGTVNSLLRNLFQTPSFRGKKTVSDTYLLLFGVLVFSLLLIGIIITGIEYKRLEKEQTDTDYNDVGKR